MLDDLHAYFLTQPRRLVALGRALVHAGAFLLVFGAIGHAAMVSVSAAQGDATRKYPAVALAETLPGFLSWLMPESVLGFGLALLLLVAGLAAVLTGRAYERVWRY